MFSGQAGRKWLLHTWPLAGNWDISLCDVAEHFFALLIKPITARLFDRWDPLSSHFSHSLLLPPPPPPHPLAPLLYCNLICTSYLNSCYITFPPIASICIICSPSYPLFTLSLNLNFSPTLVHYLPLIPCLALPPHFSFLFGSRGFFFSSFL